MGTVDTIEKQSILIREVYRPMFIKIFCSTEFKVN